MEELGLLVPNVAEDRISHLMACVLREFFVRYTETQAAAFSIPTKSFRVPAIWDADVLAWRTGLKAELPFHPDRETPLLLAPLDLLRHLPWINYPNYYKSYFSRHVLPTARAKQRVAKRQVLAHNRANYENVMRYVRAKEQSAEPAKPDPLFEPLKLGTLQRKLRVLRKVATGAGESAKQYEDLVTGILSSALYPELEFAQAQARTDSGAHIRDLLFYNDGKTEFTKALRDDYGSRQLVFELKNVKELEPGHVWFCIATGSARFSGGPREPRSDSTRVRNNL